ncbi:hypothetical protein BDY24DRAFT_7612 [Mrakia frigida]|uniref:uncharacterized protein n=1 Tax=Mrakia frigida TaxID=29902 RepID=UPI003FCC1C68
MSHSHHSSTSSLTHQHQHQETPITPPAEGAATKGIRWMREGLGIDFDPEQQLDLDSFARELDRLDRLCPPSSPKNVDDVDANSHEEVSSWIGSTGASGTEEEERRLVKQRILISKMEALEKAKTEVLKLELEVSELKTELRLESSRKEEEEDADWEAEHDAEDFGEAREGG